MICAHVGSADVTHTYKCGGVGARVGVGQPLITQRKYIVKGLAVWVSKGEVTNAPTRGHGPSAGEKWATLRTGHAGGPHEISRS